MERNIAQRGWRRRRRQQRRDGVSSRTLGGWSNLLQWSQRTGGVRRGWRCSESIYICRVRIYPPMYPFLPLPPSLYLPLSPSVSLHPSSHLYSPQKVLALGYDWSCRSCEAFPRRVPLCGRAGSVTVGCAHVLTHYCLRLVTCRFFCLILFHEDFVEILVAIIPVLLIIILFLVKE